MLERTTSLYSSKISDGNNHALLALGKIINREAYVMAYADVYFALAISLFVVVGLVLLIKVRMAPGSAAPVDH